MSSQASVVTQVNNLLGIKHSKEEILDHYNKWGDRYDTVSTMLY